MKRKEEDAIEVLGVVRDRHRLDMFLRQSLLIEGIVREPTGLEISATEEFLERPKLDVDAVVSLVGVYEPKAKLRDKAGYDVRVGDHFPMKGGPRVLTTLKSILREVNESRWNPYQAHCQYETLHPFLDGNGRSGRAIWLWQMKHEGQYEKALALGFLHTWYYQSLAGGR